MLMSAPILLPRYRQMLLMTAMSKLTHLHSKTFEYEIAICIPQAVVPEEESMLQRDLPRPLEHHLHDLIKLTTKVLVK